MTMYAEVITIAILQTAKCEQTTAIEVVNLLRNDWKATSWRNTTICNAPLWTSQPISFSRTP